YDQSRRVVVMFGGFGDNGLLGDTWEYALPLGSGQFAASDNVAILLRRQRIEGGIRLSTFDRFSGEPEFSRTGEGWCESCFFASDIGGFESLKTSSGDAAYPITGQTFEVD